MRRTIEVSFLVLAFSIFTVGSAGAGFAQDVGVRMNSRVATILSALKDTSAATGRVFALQSPRHWFEPAVSAVGLKDFTWHCLRHTFASRLVLAGVDIRTVQELMGHKS